MTGSRIGVAFDMTFPNRNRAGSGQYARSLLAGLQARDDVEVLELAGPSRSGLAGTLRWMLRDASNHVAAAHVALLHCPAFVTPWNVKVPNVISVLDVATRRFPRDYPFEWRAYEGNLLPGQARKAALVVAISENTRQDVIAHYKVPPDKVVTIYPGVAQEFAAAPHAERDPEAPLLLFPGAPRSRKNLELVLLSLASAAPGSALAAATLQISGANAADFPEHVAAIADGGLSNRVRWLGQVPAERMPAIMAETSAVVYPSLYEGFGFPPLEAMAAGTPVVASNTSCLPEVLGDAALLVDPQDDAAFGAALEDVLTKPEVRDRLIAAGRERVRMFTWEKSAAQTVDAYRRVLAR